MKKRNQILEVIVEPTDVLKSEMGQIRGGNAAAGCTKCKKDGKIVIKEPK